MKQKLIDLFQNIGNSQAKIGRKIMTHLVAGYPSLETNLSTLKTMADNGADIVEIQLPFSDPMADGPTIMKANQEALNTGISVQKVFDFLPQLVKSVDIPVMIMTYYNIPFNIGLETFFEKAEKAGVCGVIIPDIPFDNQQEDFLKRIAPYDLFPVMVVSPGMDSDRLRKIVSCASGMLYTTLRTGITGSKTMISSESLEYIEQLKLFINQEFEETYLPIAAGFGISSLEQVTQVTKMVDVAVIGSKFIQYFDDFPENEAIQKIGEFLSICKSTT